MKCLRRRVIWSTPLAAIALLAVTAISTDMTRARAEEPFLRGDVNTDGRVSISDAMAGRRWLFLGGYIPCPNALDVDDDGHAMITDTVRILQFLFSEGDPPAAPYPEVGPDPTSNEGDTPWEEHGDVPWPATCPEYNVTEPAHTDDVVQIGDLEGAPGDRVRAPVYVTSSQAVEAIQLVIAYDPSLFTPLEGDGRGWLEGPAFEGSYYEDADFLIAYGIVEVRETDGVILIGFAPGLIDDELQLPPDTEAPVFHILGEIPLDAPAGVSTELLPTNGPDGTGYGPAGMRNELTHQGDARLVSTEPHLEGGILKIVGDQIFFRGDSNGDGTLEMVDAQVTLDYLFTGGARPACFDAADANDDGLIDLTDPVRTLMYLYSGGEALPPPFTKEGLDPTADSMDCVSISEA